jgi:hypothetical protein
VLGSCWRIPPSKLMKLRRTAAAKPIAKAALSSQRHGRQRGAQRCSVRVGVELGSAGKRFSEPRDRSGGFRATGLRETVLA